MWLITDNTNHILYENGGKVGTTTGTTLPADHCTAFWVTDSGSSSWPGYLVNVGSSIYWNSIQAMTDVPLYSQEMTAAGEFTVYNQVFV